MVFLTVPYAEKDAAKALGARWNPTRRCWYVPDGTASEPFAQWIVATPGGAAPGAKPAASGARPAPAGRVDSYQGKTVVGVNYTALDHDCNPLEACPDCTARLNGMPWAQAQAAVLAVIAAMPGTSNVRSPSAKAP